VTDSSDFGQNMATSTAPVTGTAIAGLLGQSSLFANDWYARGAFISDKTNFPEWWQVSFWVQTSAPASSGAARVIFDVVSPDSIGGVASLTILTAFIDSAGKVNALLADPGGNFRWSKTTVVITDGNPHHITISFYAVTQNTGISFEHVIEIFVDGQTGVTNTLSSVFDGIDFYGTLTVGNTFSSVTSSWYNATLGLNPVGFVGNLQDLAFN